MKKLAAITIALLFLYNSMGYFILFEVSVAKVKREMKAAASRNPAGVVVFEQHELSSDPEFRGLDHKELIFQNRMYDIVRIAGTGPETRYYCIADVKEQKLKDALKKESKTRDYKTVFDHIIKIAVPGHDRTIESPAGMDLRYPELKQTITSLMVIPPEPPPWSA